LIDAFQADITAKDRAPPSAKDAAAACKDNAAAKAEYDSQVLKHYQSCTDANLFCFVKFERCEDGNCSAKCAACYGDVIQLGSDAEGISKALLRLRQHAATGKHMKNWLVSGRQFA
jgi:hypothetical protein